LAPTPALPRKQGREKGGSYFFEVFFASPRLCGFAALRLCESSLFQVSVFLPGSASLREIELDSSTPGALPLPGRPGCLVFLCASASLRENRLFNFPPPTPPLVLMANALKWLRCRGGFG
jgi:hypothetical protein